MRKYLTTDDIEKLSKMSSTKISEFMTKNFPVSDEERAEFQSLHNKLTYYKIHDLNLLGKKEKGILYVYINGTWKMDDDNIVSDRLIGYDDESIGSSTIFDIDEITEFEALNIIEKTNG